MSSVRRGLLIGAGYFSDFHLDAWSRMPNAEIVCVCDLDLDRAKAAAHKYSIADATDDLAQALSNDDLDFVDVATKPDGRLNLIRQVVDRQLPIICQKPLENTFADACQLIDLVQSSELPFMVHENFRFQPWYREIKHILTGGQLGERIHTLQMRTRTGDGWGPDAYLGRQPYFRDMPRLLIHETGVHFVDTFRYLAGEIVECSADIRRLNSVIRGEDTGTLSFVFANGARGTWDANRFNEPRPFPFAGGSRPDSFQDFNPRYTFGELLVETDGGSIWLDSDGSLTIKPLGMESQRHEYVPSKKGFGGDCVYATQSHFIDYLDGKTSCETDGAEYRKTLRVVESLYESANSGRSVRVGSSQRFARPTERVVDLSLPISEEMAGIQIATARTIDRDGWNATTLNFYSHAGTHMDAPCHFLLGGPTLDQQDLSVCCGRARVVNLAPTPAKHLISVDDVIQAIGPVEPGDRLLFRTDWYHRFGTSEYRNELPRISLELARWLVERRVAMIGVEPPSVADVNNMVELTEVHQTLFRGGVLIVEGLAYLDQLTQPQVQFIALPLRILGGDGCPVRAIAIEGGLSL